MEALVCLKPGELVVEERPGRNTRPGGRPAAHSPRRHLRDRLSHLRGQSSLSAIPARDGTRAGGQRRRGRRSAAASRKDDLVVVNPYIACGTCHACRKGRPNCCMNIAVLGVHRDGGMTEFISVPETNLYPAGGLTPDQAATRRIPGHRRTWRQPRRRVGAVRPYAGHRRRPDRHRRGDLRPDRRTTRHPHGCRRANGCRNRNG